MEVVELINEINDLKKKLDTKKQELHNLQKFEKIKREKEKWLDRYFILAPSFEKIESPHEFEINLVYLKIVEVNDFGILYDRIVGNHLQKKNPFSIDVDRLIEISKKEYDEQLKKVTK